MEKILFGNPEVMEARPPLLFVHGSYCGAWVWEKHFLPFFEEEGWSGAAISLRGHGKNDDLHVDFFGVADYLEDIEKATRFFDEPPILIGHSLGGYLAQKYAMQNKVAGLVLLASPSLRGLWASAQHISLTRPQLGFELSRLMMFGPSFVDAEVIANALFSAGMPSSEMTEMFPLLQRESFRVSLEASVPDFSLPPEPAPPTLVIGGDNDAFIPRHDLVHTAAFWDARLEIIPDLPHGAMMDPTWPLAAQPIKSWLDERAACRVSN